MIAFLLSIYTAIVIVLFKLKIIRPRPYPIALVLVVGIFLIGGVFVVWQQSAPLSSRVVTSQYVVQLVPYVKGQITKVYARANQQIKKGDRLLEIDPAPYQYKVDQLTAQLEAAQEGVNQAQAALDAAKSNVVSAAAGIDLAKAGIEQSQAAVANAKAGVAKAQAGLADSQAGEAKAVAADELAKTEEKIALNLQQSDAGAISVLKVNQAVQNREAADAALDQAKTDVGQAEAALQQAEAGVAQSEAVLKQADAQLAGAQSTEQQALAAERQAAFAVKVAATKIPAVQATLDDARFDLQQCTMYAPADGYVVNWQVQEGTMLVPMPMAPAGTFIATSDVAVVASFPQNYLSHVQSGDMVELVLSTYPGRMFRGTVDTVITATGEGQFAPSGAIPQAANVGSAGLLAVKIKLDGDAPPGLPLGAGGTVAIYTKSGKPVHIISKVTIRMKKWLLYVIPS